MEEDIGYEEDTLEDDMEASRIARFMLYKNRMKQPVRRTQIRQIMDSFKNKSKKKDPVVRAGRILKESVGLTIEESHNKEKNANPKYYVVRSEEYDESFPIPFTDEQKEIYGLLLYVFIIIRLKNNQIEIKALWQILQNAGVDSDSPVFGKWPEIINTWEKQEYLTSTKASKDDEILREITFGPRFYVEYGEDLIDEIAQNMIKDEETA